MKLGVLGPKGSFTDSAADEIKGDKVYFEKITDVIKAVNNNEVDKGVVPIENSLHGTVVASLDAINEFNLFIEKDIIIPIHQCIAGLSNYIKPSIILSHPQALAQTKNYLEKNYLNAKLVKTLSTSEAFKRISEDGLLDALAVGSKKAAKVYGLQIIDSEIEDEKNNVTKFFVIKKNNEVLNGASKTFVVIYPNKDVQGILLKMLTYFDEYKINLTKIESRPSRKKLGNYLFYIEFEGNINKEEVKTTLENIKNNVGSVKVLGCY